ncbi:endolytic transglycosylase MltG [Microbacterium excoecariae]|uniref:endolytic transglycosylase MltG n=1 Tax=Microbacterium excoecariae TaxID=2715210 RepID=UPI0014080156|nr:endolytic transglycosylase MltG [Microbacterium excoecariae]NHI17122.1 endolytic transglycosylase MltG [Microbacterium excoecariae]
MSESEPRPDASLTRRELRARRLRESGDAPRADTEAPGAGSVPEASATDSEAPATGPAEAPGPFVTAALNVEAARRRLPAAEPTDASGPQPSRVASARPAPSARPASDAPAPAAGAREPAAASAPAGETHPGGAHDGDAPHDEHDGIGSLFGPDHDEARVREAKGRRRRRGGCFVALAVVLGLLAAVVGGGWWALSTFADSEIGQRVQQVLGINQEPAEYESGIATGSAEIQIVAGDTGWEISQKLHEAGVTLTESAFYDMLVGAQLNPEFLPGVYQLQQQMTSAAALTALEDPENRIDNAVLVTEGSFARDALETISEVTEIPLEELENAAADYAAFGVPEEAPSIEGFLFPATYTFDPDATAEEVIQTLVDEMFDRLDALGVAEDDRLEVLTMAALVQREAGGEDDMPKIARVFFNRIDEGMLLQSDATVAYGADSTHTVWTTDEQRADASNPYNTYVHEGLPVGPIGLPGEAAIRAAIDPADGNWLYFVPVNLSTGETVFSATLEEHEAATARLQEWCQASDENAAYCE